MCWFQGHRKDLEIVATLQALHLVVGVGGGCIQPGTSQQAVEGCTHQRCLGKAKATLAQSGVYTWVSSKGWIEVGQVRKKKGHCKQRDKGCMMTLLEHQAASESRSVMSDSLRPHELYSPWNSPGQNTRGGSHSLLQGIFQTHRWKPGLLYCGQILYQLSHKGSPRTRVCSLSHLQWIFLSQESNRGLLHCRRILYQLSCRERGSEGETNPAHAEP